MYQLATISVALFILVGKAQAICPTPLCADITCRIEIPFGAECPTCICDLQPIIQRCCQSGESWAKNHTTCTGQTMEWVDIKDRMACQSSFYICCVREHRRTDCDRGKATAKAIRQCHTRNQNGEAFKDCCQGCILGIQASLTPTPCKFTQFSFGALWDAAFVECCENSKPDNLQVTTSAPIDRCETENPCSQICNDVGNEIRCSCEEGYRLALDRRTCEDIDECKLITCPSDKTCLNTPGSYACVASTPLCASGFRYVERTSKCIDIDECAEFLSNCDENRQICVNSHGSFYCADKPRKNRDCPAGFKWNDAKDNCNDVDECQEQLDDCIKPDEMCRNTRGGYECDTLCPTTMRFDGNRQKCVARDACSAGNHNCKPHQTCIPTQNSFICSPQELTEGCQPGFKPASGSNRASEPCEDINECEEYPDTCDTGEQCINSIGSYDCIPEEQPRQQEEQNRQQQEQQLQQQQSTFGNTQRLCPGGFILNRNDECIDVDECIENFDHCNRLTHQCVNLNGSYECIIKSDVQTCPPGFRKEARTGECKDVNECLEGHKCLLSEEQCINVEGGYHCQPLVRSTCPSGTRYNATTQLCDDVDECIERLHSCDLDAQNCINVIGSYRCVAKPSCPYGYQWSRHGNKCDDIDECSEGSDDCNRRTQNCVNTAGSFQCQYRPIQQGCGTGYIYDSNSESCVDRNECELSHSCEHDQICENTLGSYRCVCNQGWTMDTLNRKCIDINECQLRIHTCAGSQRCDNTIGSYACIRTTSCGTGYTLNAATNECEDDDECLLNTHNCGPGFECRNTAGSFRCARIKCPSGQKLLSDGTCKIVTCDRGMETDDSGNCIDINECARGNVCRPNQRCFNTIGSYRCQYLVQCEPGYELNESGNQCTDIDECARGIFECGPQQTCRNRPGTYACECPRGYTLNALRECEDIDECIRFRGQVCSSISECINTQGSYTCNCKDGFKKADDNKNCIDVDECAESPNICQQTCNNLWGSYQCSCKQGYTLGPDDRSCQDIDECKMMEGRGNLCIGFCNNIPGSYTCSCPSGYRLLSDKRTCHDIDECLEENACNGPEEICLNTRGGYKCNRIVCPPSYIRDKDHKNRCKRVLRDCRRDDNQCLKEPLSFSYNYITFVSNMRIPPSGQLDLFTMRGPRFQSTTVQFTLELKEARASTSVPAATREFFYLRRTSHNEAMVSLIKPIQGPQDIELDLIMKMYHNGLFGGMAIAKIILFVTPHEF